MKFDLNVATSIQLPVVVARGFVGIPSSEVRGEFTKQLDIRAIKTSEYYHNFLVIVTEPVKGLDFETIDNYYKRAVVARVISNIAPTQNINRVKFDVVMRCDIENLESSSECLMANVTTVPSFVSNADEILASKRLIKEEINNKTSNTDDQVTNQKISLLLSRELEDTELSDSIAAIVASNISDRQKYLFELDATKRFVFLVADLRKHQLIDQLEKKIDEDVRNNINEQQKEYYLREKMRAIQEELGDKAKKESEIDELREKIIAAKMPKTMEDKCLVELNRYSSIGSQSPESTIIKTYLDFVLSLPWNISTTDSTDIKRAKEILDEDHYGLDKVKNRILEYLAVRVMTKEKPQAILCLVGPPGVGKTSIARSVARALNKEFVKQSLGGVKDESEIRGHRRTYLGALPGRILQSLARAKSNNPVFLLDEIDKMGADYKGDPTAAMLEVLDPEQNRYFSDNYVEEPFDLSQCFFIATANYLENIPAPLRDRLEIVHLSSYTEHEKFNIGKDFLVAKQVKLNGLEMDKFSLSDDAIYAIIQKYTREAGVRELERMIGKITRKAVKNILMDGLDRVDVTEANLEDYLGKPIFSNNESLAKDEVGVVTGLAYTEYGGDTLQVEVTHYQGKGGLILTGKLGDVMKESAQTALSYVKANASKYEIDYEMFENQDIHIHFPEGAVPKDGPSAGVTIVTAVVSAFTNTPVDHLIGMTGEITLRGRVLPIGGLKEKSIAAARSGLKRILIPRENLKDLDEIPNTVKEQLEIIPIDEACEAISYALVK